MRRKEFLVDESNQDDVKTFITEANYGCLALNRPNEDYPMLIPLNFVYLDDIIYFHGSRVGEKMGLVTAQPTKATFAITEEFAIIPSYLDDPYFACPASTLYKSVIAYGAVSVVTNEETKHKVLDALMQKLQPEGGYAPISIEDESYKKRVFTTAVIQFEVDRLSAKFKFGQNWKDEKREKVTTHLLDRNRELDVETVQLMKRYCPYQKGE